MGFFNPSSSISGHGVCHASRIVYDALLSHVHAQGGKVIGRVIVIVIVESTKFTLSRDLGT